MVKLPSEEEVYQNLEAEKQVLGAILLDNNVLKKELLGLKSDHFYRAAHKVIFDTMKTLEAEEKPIDTIELIQLLKDRKRLDDVGGLQYITSLLHNVVTTVRCPYHAQLIIGEWQKRQLLLEVLKIREGLRAGRSASDVAADLEKTLKTISMEQASSDLPVNAEDICTEYLELTEKAGAESWPRTGFKSLDAILLGLRPGTLNILAARPAMGKTALALALARNLVEDEKRRVAFFSLEMSNNQIMERLLAAISGIDSRTIADGKASEGALGKQLAEACAVISRKNQQLFLYELANCSVEDILRKAFALKSRFGLDMIIIDYLQLMAAKRYVGNKVQEVSEISRGLKLLAKQLDVPVVALAQLNRAVEMRNDRHPLLSDLRDSGSIEQDADTVILLFRKEYYDNTCEEGLTEAIVAKNRFGPTGTANLRFEGNTARFEDCGLKEPERKARARKQKNSTAQIQEN